MDDQSICLECGSPFNPEFYQKSKKFRYKKCVNCRNRSDVRKVDEFLSFGFVLPKWIRKDSTKDLCHVTVSRNSFQINKSFSEPREAIKFLREVMLGLHEDMWKKYRERKFTDEELRNKAKRQMKKLLSDPEMAKKAHETRMTGAAKWRKDNPHLVEKNLRSNDSIKKRSLNMTGRSRDNISKKWSIRSPNGIVYKFINLNRFCRENFHLFEWKGSFKKTWKLARSGLEKMRPYSNRKRVSGSYKGWTWYSALEEKLNEGKDLLDRDL